MANLPTNLKDDIYSGKRMYQMTTVSTGVVTLDDVTTYTQQGSAISAQYLNDICKAVNRINSSVTFTLNANEWTKNGNTYTQTKKPTLPNGDAYSNDSTPLWYLNASATDELIEAFSYIGSCEETTNGFVFTCGTERPTVDVPIKVKGY